MTLNAALQRRFDQTVTVQASTGYNSRGDRQFSTSSTTHVARVDYRQHLVRGANGREQVARGTVYVGPSSTGGAPAVTAQSKLTLPDGTAPTIMAVETIRDRTSVNHQAVHFG